MRYKKLWSDMHSNLHHEQITKLPQWFEQVKKTMDFWPFAYYPFYMRMLPSGLAVEDCHDSIKIQKDWEYIRTFTQAVNDEGFAMFMGYEWQGNGKDGDHNVFFLDNAQAMHHPMSYSELLACYQDIEAIGIPHHVAYQLGSRGKNWATHNEKFSPFVEIYSSHGCSESDDGALPMNRHIHMGPRTAETCYERAIEKGLKVGVIASGDNHSVPGIYEHGSMCVLATECSKLAIWDAFLQRRVYGVSKSRIELDFQIDDTYMGGEVKVSTLAHLKFKVKGSNAIDRIEILKGTVVDEMVVHSGTWEYRKLPDKVRFKFQVAFGWGPDQRVYPDVDKKKWHGKLICGNGKLLSIEKCWNNFGQRLYHVDDHSCEFDLTTYKTTASGKWMGPGNITTEGFIFEVEADRKDTLMLMVEDKTYLLNVNDYLAKGKVFALWDEIQQFTKACWGDVEHYRDDPWWHNAYKFKVHRFALEEAYCVTYEKTITITQDCSYRLRVWQKDGDCAWSSPIFLKRK